MTDQIRGTLDDMEPRLRAMGFSAVRTMAGPIDLAAFDPYGMRRVGSVNIQSEKWAHHVWRGVFIERDGAAFIADEKEPREGDFFIRGAFELIRVPDPGYCEFCGHGTDCIVCRRGLPA